MKIHVIILLCNLFYITSAKSLIPGIHNFSKYKGLKQVSKIVSNETNGNEIGGDWFFPNPTADKLDFMNLNVRFTHNGNIFAYIQGNILYTRMYAPDEDIDNAWKWYAISNVDLSPHLNCGGKSQSNVMSIQLSDKYKMLFIGLGQLNSVTDTSSKPSCIRVFKLNALTRGWDSHYANGYIPIPEEYDKGGSAAFGYKMINFQDELLVIGAPGAFHGNDFNAGAISLYKMEDIFEKNVTIMTQIRPLVNTFIPRQKSDIPQYSWGLEFQVQKVKTSVVLFGTTLTWGAISKTWAFNQVTIEMTGLVVRTGELHTTSAYNPDCKIMQNYMYIWEYKIQVDLLLADVDAPNRVNALYRCLFNERQSSTRTFAARHWFNLISDSDFFPTTGSITSTKGEEDTVYNSFAKPYHDVKYAYMQSYDHDRAAVIMKQPWNDDRLYMERLWNGDYAYIPLKDATKTEQGNIPSSVYSGNYWFMVRNLYGETFRVRTYKKEPDVTRLFPYARQETLDSLTSKKEITDTVKAMDCKDFFMVLRRKAGNLDVYYWEENREDKNMKWEIIETVKAQAGESSNMKFSISDIDNAIVSVDIPNGGDQYAIHLDVHDLEAESMTNWKLFKNLAFDEAKGYTHVGQNVLLRRGILAIASYKIGADQESVVFFYKYTSPNIFHFIAKVQHPQKEKGTDFGVSLEVALDTLIVGCSKCNNGKGSVTTFDLQNQGSFKEEITCGNGNPISEYAKSIHYVTYKNWDFLMISQTARQSNKAHSIVRFRDDKWQDCKILQKEEIWGGDLAYGSETQLVVFPADEAKTDYRMLAVSTLGYFDQSVRDTLRFNPNALVYWDISDWDSNKIENPRFIRNTISQEVHVLQDFGSLVSSNAHGIVTIDWSTRRDQSLLNQKNDVYVIPHQSAPKPPTAQPTTPTPTGKEPTSWPTEAPTGTPYPDPTRPPVTRSPYGPDGEANVITSDTVAILIIGVVVIMACVFLGLFDLELKWPFTHHQH